MKLWRVVQVASRLEHSLKLDQMTPRGSKATIAFDYLEEAFGAGNAFPYTLVIESPEGARATIHLSDYLMRMTAHWLPRDLTTALLTKICTMLWIGDTHGIMSEQFFVETSDMLEKIVNGVNRPNGTVLGMSFI